jgi:hypothetical protein
MLVIHLHRPVLADLSPFILDAVRLAVVVE